VSDDAQEWRWVSEDGVENAVTEQELIAELSAEGLPPYTLVWKEHWLEWLPAMRVAELAWALPPGKAERAMKPRESATAVQPPSPPLYLYPVLKRRPSFPVDAADVGELARSRPAASGNPEPRPAPSPDNEVTLVADGGLVDSDASFERVGPGKAVLGARAYSEEDDGDTHIIRSRPPAPGAVYVAPHTPPQSERPEPAYEEEEIPVIPRPPPPPADLSNYTRFSPHAEVELEQPFPKPKPSMRSIALASAAAAFGVGAALLLLHAFRSGDGPAEDASTAGAVSAPSRQPSAPSAAAASETPLRGAPCTIVTPAMRLADWAEPLVPPLFAPIPGSTRIAVGYAQSETYAVGLTIDPRTLDRDQVYREFRREKLVSVVPTTGSGKLHFEIVRQGNPLANARAVDGPAPFVLGATPYAIARRQKDGSVPLWSLADADQGTVPRVAALTSRGYAVAIRRAGKNGAISVGYLDEDGNKKTELAEVRADAVATGTPALAASDKSLLVSFATRATAGSPWSIAAGVAGLGESPRKAAPLALRGGGPGGDRVGAAVGALGGGRWLVEWTEGSAGSRVVRAEVLDENLAPFAEATDVSPPGVNAGQGVVWTNGDLATILFFVRNDKNNNALWGVSLECPRSS
jgi:hypothetical protein